MRKFVAFIAAGMALCSFYSCQKDATLKSASPVITEETLSKIKALGFGISDVQVVDGGYLVEGDMIVSEEMLNRGGDTKTLRIAEVEQYRTFNRVTGLPRNITVSVSGTVPAAFSTAVNNAIARYNTEKLQVTFSRVSNGGNIVIKIVNTGQYIASAGFPSSSGTPYSEVKYAKKYTTYSDGFMTTVLTHEIGHCIGFRHTDYMNRAYSCGSGGNEGQATTGVGAVHIPGTPTGPDAASWMLSCLSATTNRPFNANDKTALNYVY